MRARFDDLRRTTSRSFGFDGLVGEIVAHDVDEVAAALVAAEAAAAGGSWVAGFVAYEAAPAFDRAFRVTARPDGDVHRWLPLVWFGVFTEKVDDPPWPDGGTYALGTWSSTTSREDYDAAIAAIHEHIRQGDTYQVNYATRLRAPFSGDPIAHYRDLCAAQSGGYGAYLDCGRFRVLSASPELFFERRDDRIVTRPMKGTAPRGGTKAQDDRRRDELVASVKDRAENVMIVDLLRNDLGRIARFGSVSVDRLFEPERYDTLWQLTSTVSAEVSPRVGLVDTFEALFPCGSITGAPKVRTMEIIAELEDHPRGVYCGAIGYLAPPGADGPSAAFSVAIRTVVVDIEDGDAEYGVGGGIVFDSSAAGEYEEMLVKARVLTRSRQSFRLLETIRWEADAGFVLLDRHLDRLEESAAYFAFRCDRSVVLAALERAVAGRDAGPGRLRLLVDRAGGVEVEVSDLSRLADPYRVVIDDDPIDISDPFLFHKTTNRTTYDMRRVRHASADDVILVNDRGEVTESTIANVLVRLDGQWLTPPISSGCLPGVARAQLVEEGSVAEWPITVEDLLGAEVIELVNSVRGRWAVTIDGVSAPGGSASEPR